MINKHVIVLFALAVGMAMLSPAQPQQHQYGSIVESKQAPPITAGVPVQPAPAAVAQSAPTKAPVLDAPAEASTSLHRVVIQAGVKAQRAGEISRLELFRLRVAMLSPAFRDRVADLAVVQMVASESAEVPLTFSEDGTIDKTNIDWDGLINFIERLLPLILQLISLFGG